MVSKQNHLRTTIAPELQGWVDNRLISAHIRIVRMMILGTLLNGFALVAGVGAMVPGALLWVFAISLMGAAYHRVWLAQGIERARRQRNPAKMLHAFRMNSLWLGLTFGIAIALWLPLVSPGGKLLLAIVAIAQIASAAYTVRTMPRAAVLYIVPQALGLAAGLASVYELAALFAVAVLLSASGLLIRMAYTAHDLFVTRIVHDRELSASARTVKLLLNEYEESGSDWLFELDLDGRLVGVTDRLAAALGKSRSKLETHAFSALFAPGKARDDLLTALAERRPLRDQTIEVAPGTGRAGEDGEPRWWSVSGRPCYASPGDRVVYRGVIADVTSQRLAESRVHHMAHFDALTGLPNRALFNATIARLLDERARGERVALLLIDVDHFKSVNDMYGHPTGDGFLRKLAERMTATLESSRLGGEQRLVARLGGDEFAIVLAGDDAVDQAVRLADALVTAMSEPVMVDNHILETGISLGIAMCPDHATLPQQLLSNADIALYAAKDGGRGMWEMFEPGMDEELHDRHALTRDLRHAVGNGELRLYLQPLIELERDVKTGYEALLRWEHAERGLINPDDFIPLAEDTGLIVPIGEWVIRTAFALAVEWEDGKTIAINLSPVQLNSPNLLPVIVNALAETGIDPGRVEFEITEGVLLHNSAANIETLNKMHELGLKIALDDFGTGYASLNYLLTFPFDKIKIDRSFISDLGTREDSRAIVGAVIGLANKLGMCTLAEGVEEEGQVAELREHGCRMVQGWLYGKALPSEDYQPAAVKLLAGTEVAVISAKPAALPRKRAGSADRRAAG